MLNPVTARFICPRLGRESFGRGETLAANPYRVGTLYARLWADGWLASWMGA